MSKEILAKCGRMRWLAMTAAAVFSLGAPALANDGFGGLTATGLQFGRTDAVTMASEDLFIGLEKIRVEYVFKNLTDQDVTGEMIFPLPPISVWGMQEQMINLPEAPFPDNLVSFTAEVDGKPIAVKIDRVAVIEPEYEDNTPIALQYDTPGRDVTKELLAAGLPLTIDFDTVHSALGDLSLAQQEALEAAGLAEFHDPVDAGMPREGFPKWSIIYRYHWSQTFPAGQELRVSHGYDNRPPASTFYWEHPVKEEYLGYYVDRYCVDEGTSKAMAKAVLHKDPDTGEEWRSSTAFYTTYVLRTANSWAGPIGTFRLTVDKGVPGNVISLCQPGLKKIGPTSFSVERKNYTPERDLEILVVVSDRS